MASTGHPSITLNIFGEKGGDRLAQEFGVTLLGRLPLKMDIREQTDAGRPPLVADPESPVSLEYRQIALQVAAAVWQQSLEGVGGPEIAIADD